MAALTVAGITQLVDRGRFLVFALPLAFDRSVRASTEANLGGPLTAVVAAGAVGGVFLAWGLLVGAAFHWSLNEFPRSTRSFLTNHPAVLAVTMSAIDGFPKSSVGSPAVNDDISTIGPYGHLDSRRARLRVAVTRGLKTAFIFGTTAHVGVSKVSGYSNRATRTRTFVVAAEAAVMLGLIAALLSALLTLDFLGVAQNIRDVITDRRVLIAVSVAVITFSVYDNFRQRSRVAAV